MAHHVPIHQGLLAAAEKRLLVDGTLARVRRAERPRYGFYVDHVLDIVGITLLLGGLACSGLPPRGWASPSRWR